MIRATPGPGDAIVSGRRLHVFLQRVLSSVDAFDPPGGDIGDGQRADRRLEPVRARATVGVGRQQDAVHIAGQRRLADRHRRPAGAAGMRVIGRTAPFGPDGERQGRRRVGEDRGAAVAAIVQEEAADDPRRAALEAGECREEVGQFVLFVANGNTDRDGRRRRQGAPMCQLWLDFRL